MLSITVSEGQCLIDIAVQYLGDPERVFEVMELNNLNLTDEPAPGTKLKVPDVLVEKKSITDTFYNRQLIPASIPDSELGIDVEDFEGIDYWAIEDDFIISGLLGVGTERFKIL